MNDRSSRCLAHSALLRPAHTATFDFAKGALLSLGVSALHMAQANQTMADFDEEQLRQEQQYEVFEARFRPSAERLREIAEQCADTLSIATIEELSAFSE